MGQAYGQLLPANYTSAQLAAAILNVATQAWGSPTYYGPSGSYPMGGRQYIEWPDIGGRKHVWECLSSTAVMPRIANSRQPNGTSVIYRGTSQVASFGVDPSNKTVPVYVMAIAGTDYRVLSITSSVSQYASCVALFRGAISWWGTYPRIYITGDRSTIQTLPGLNPFGALNSSNEPNPAGRTNFSLDATNIVRTLNPLTNKRTVRLQEHFADDLYGVVGFYPGDQGIAHSSGVSTTVPVLYDAGAGNLFISVNTLSNGQWVWRITASPFTGLTTYPADLYDFGNPPEGVYTGEPAGPAEPVRRVTGQIFPDPSALDLQQGTTP